MTTKKTETKTKTKPKPKAKSTLKNENPLGETSVGEKANELNDTSRVKATETQDAPVEIAPLCSHCGTRVIPRRNNIGECFMSCDCGGLPRVAAVAATKPEVVQLYCKLLVAAR